MTSLEALEVEVAYALPEQQWLVRVRLPPGARAVQAVSAARGTPGFPELVDQPPRIAIWGQPAALEDELRPGDRVEILRPLKIDPRAARRELAAAGRVMGAQGGTNSD